MNDQRTQGTAQDVARSGPTPRYLPFNINHHVRVKLTDAGRAWHRKRHAEWFANAPHIKYTPPVEDVDGWSRWQMHTLMETFGDGVGMGRDLLFETTIELDTSEQ